MPNDIVILSAAIAGIALHGVNDAVFNLFENAHMVSLPVLRAGITKAAVL